MGTVWLAEHTMLGRRAALKVLHSTFSNRPDILTRFFNEARAAASISDPGIVQIFDFGHHVDGSAYIVMELLEGEPLDKRIARTQMSLHDALRIMRQVANSLGVAHAHGIVHRDLKPENIFLVRDAEVIGGERAKILDFGIAKLFGESNIKTQTAAMLGTPIYMSPEQCRGAGHVDERSDIYSLGCVLFRLIVGRPPFDAEGHGEIIAMHLREPAPRLSRFVTGIPTAIEDLVQRCLDKEPGRRFASGAALAEVIQEISSTGDYKGQSSSPSRGVVVVPHTTLSASAVALQNARAPRRRSFTILLASSLALIVAASVIVLTWGSNATLSVPPVAPLPTEIPPRAAAPVALSNQPDAAGDIAPDASVPDRGSVIGATPSTPPTALSADTAPVSPESSEELPRKADTVPTKKKRASNPSSDSRPLAISDNSTPSLGAITSVGRVALAASPPAASPPAASSPAASSPAASRPAASRPASRPAASPPAASRPAVSPPTASPPTASPPAASPPAASSPAASPPTGTSTDGVPEKLERRMVATGLAAVRESVMACGAGFPGVRITASVIVSPEGDITDIVIKNSPDPRLSSCVSARIMPAHFATTRRGGIFHQPFEFGSEP